MISFIPLCRGRNRNTKLSTEDKIQLQPVEKLNHERIIHISVGAYHCIALSATNAVYCWGGLGGQQEEESVIREPVLLKVVSQLGITHIATGPHQVGVFYLGQHINQDRA